MGKIEGHNAPLGDLDPVVVAELSAVFTTVNLQTAGTPEILRKASARGDFPILVRNMEIIPKEFDSIIKFITFDHQAASTEKRGTDPP